MVTYKQSGVNIDMGNLLVQRIKRKMPHIGGFAGLFPLSKLKDASYLVASADGVGTKLKLAFKFNKHFGVGIDLVAMNVNDIICCGARPLFFLDYYATSKLNIDQAESVISGIIEGCKMAGCMLLGGETAEMPGFYKGNEYDLAGFAVGLVNSKEVVQNKDIRAGDVIMGLHSSGPHSNGYSLIRKALKPAELKEHQSALLKPTKIYVKDIQKLRGKRIKIKGLSHITGGGFYDNIPRVLPNGTQAKIFSMGWSVPKIFDVIQHKGKIPREEMYRVFNMGIGMILILDKNNAAKVRGIIPEASLIGEIVKGKRKVIIKWSMDEFNNWSSCIRKRE
ncbi:MAG: phosphoribosylformylglycinamidine cyclo-ligase [bacterium]